MYTTRRFSTNVLTNKCNFCGKHSYSEQTDGKAFILKLFTIYNLIFRQSCEMQEGLPLPAGGWIHTKRETWPETELERKSRHEGTQRFFSSLRALLQKEIAELQRP
jgi:hypothetical protein